MCTPVLFCLHLYSLLDIFRKKIRNYYDKSTNDFDKLQVNIQKHYEQLNYKNYAAAKRNKNRK